jgi:hypothetical protein
MPVIINEVEIFDAPVAPKRPAGGAAAPNRREPSHEELRRLQHDLDRRDRRLIAD